jgi:hypothetical protein
VQRDKASHTVERIKLYFGQIPNNDGVLSFSFSAKLQAVRLHSLESLFHGKIAARNIEELGRVHARTGREYGSSIAHVY